MSFGRASCYLDKLIIGGLFIMAFSSALSIAGSSIGLGLAFLGYLTKAVITRDFNSGIKNNYFNLPILIFLLTILISFIGTYNLEESIDGLEDYILFFILYYMVITTVKDVKLADKLFKTGLLSMTIASIYALGWQKYYLGMRRITANYMALDFGALLLIYLIFVIVYLVWLRKDLKGIIGYSILAILFTLTLLYNQTRGAWLGLIGAGFLVFWIRDKRWIPIFLLIIVLLGLCTPQVIQNRIKSIIDIEHSRSNLGRIALWKGSILMFRNNPINGVGIGNFQEVYDTSYTQPNTASSSHAHNNFFNFLAETGIIGLSGFIYLLYSILIYLYRSYCKVNDEYYKLFILFSFAMVFGVYVIQGMTEYNFYKSVIGRTTWFLLGLSTVIINRLIQGNNIKE